MTHVLHLTAWHPYIDGFAGSFVLEQCAALQAAGLNVGLIFSRIEGLSGFSSSKALRGFPGFVNLDVPVPTVGFKSWNMPGAQKFVRQFNQSMLTRLYRRYEERLGVPDVLHAHVALETGLAVQQLARKKGLEYILTEHSTGILNGNLNADERRLADTVYSDARCVLAVSSQLAECIQAIAPSANIKVVANLVRDRVYQLKRRVPVERSMFEIVSISSLVASKRIHYAIDAIAALPKELRRNIVYHVIGDGPERRALVNRAEQAQLNVVFHGTLPHDQAMQCLAGSDMLLHPSSYETFGIVLAEAMAVGVPVIATRCGAPETIVSEETGILVSVDSIGELTQSISNILLQIEQWRERADSISHYSRSKYHESIITNLVSKEYL